MIRRLVWIAAYAEGAIDLPEGAQVVQVEAYSEQPYGLPRTPSGAWVIMGSPLPAPPPEPPVEEAA